MKNLLFALVLTTMTSIAQAQIYTPADLSKVNQNCQSLPTPQSIEGIWYFGNFADPSANITFHMSIAISKNNTTSVLMCQGANWNLAAKVNTSSTYTSNTFSFTGSGSDQNTQGGSDCQLTIQPAHLKYSFSGGCLLLQDQMTGQGQTLYPVSP